MQTACLSRNCQKIECPALTECIGSQRCRTCPPVVDLLLGSIPNDTGELRAAPISVAIRAESHPFGSVPSWQSKLLPSILT